MNRPKSEELFALALKRIPGGVDSPVRAFRGVGGAPFFVEKGEGDRIRDADGNVYIDYVLSWGPLILGHAHPRVVRAIQEAAARGSSFGAPTALETELAELVNAAYPSMELLRFVNSGTEATMSAIRLARGFTGRDVIVKFEGCYHGPRRRAARQGGQRRRHTGRTGQRGRSGGLRAKHGHASLQRRRGGQEFLRRTRRGRGRPHHRTRRGQHGADSSRGRFFWRSCGRKPEKRAPCSSSMK